MGENKTSELLKSLDSSTSSLQRIRASIDKITEDEKLEVLERECNKLNKLLQSLERKVCDSEEEEEEDGLEEELLSPPSVHLERERVLYEFETIYENIPIGLALLDSKFRFVRVNKCLSHINAKPAEFHIGKTVPEVIPQIAQFIEPYYKEALEGGKPVADIQLKDPPLKLSRRNWLISFFPLYFPDSAPTRTTRRLSTCTRPTHVVAIVKDITELKRQEEALLKEKKSVEEANAAKSRFLAHISHELRTPMACILGMVDFLLENELTDDQYECVDAIQQNASSLLQILNDILDLSKVEAGKIVLEPVPFNLFSVTEKVMETFTYKLQEKKLQMFLKFDKKLNKNYIGDPVRIRQILWNLIGNSTKFTNYGYILVELGCDDSGVIVKVSDTGIGIPDSQLPTIFTEFKQVSNASTHVGTGLGLTIVEHIVHLMHGTVKVESKIDVGTTFTVTLPLPPAEVEVVSEPLSPPPFGNDMQVRCEIVSAVPKFREIISEYLTFCGISSIHLSETWKDAKQFITKFQENSIVVLDCETASEVYALLEEIQEKFPRNLITVIVIPFPEKPNLTAKHTHVKLVMKPVRPSCFFSVMKQILAPDQENQISPPLRRPRSSTPQKFAKVKVLVAEDNPVNRRILTRILEKMQCTVEGAANGIEALNMAKRNHYSVIFMDLQMPFLDGYNATQLIRNLESEGKIDHTPIVAVTAHAFAADRARCFEVGMDDYISKPIDVQQVEAILTKFCS